MATGPVDAAKLFHRAKLLMETPLDHTSCMKVHITSKSTFESSRVGCVRFQNDGEAHNKQRTRRDMRDTELH